MTKTIVSAAILTVFATAAGAQQYDRKLEQAAIDIAASKMGDLRGGIDVNQQLVLVAPIDRTAPTHLGANKANVIVAQAMSLLSHSF